MLYRPKARVHWVFVAQWMHSPLQNRLQSESSDAVNSAKHNSYKEFDRLLMFPSSVLRAKALHEELRSRTAPDQNQGTLRRFPRVIRVSKAPDRSLGLLEQSRLRLTRLLNSVDPMKTSDDLGLTRPFPLRSFPGQEDSNL
jgi:hypothetical protein